MKKYGARRCISLSSIMKVLKKQTYNFSTLQNEERYSLCFRAIKHFHFQFLPGAKHRGCGLWLACGQLSLIRLSLFTPPPFVVLIFLRFSVSTFGTSNYVRKTCAHPILHPLIHPQEQMNVQQFIQRLLS